MRAAAIISRWRRRRMLTAPRRPPVFFQPHYDPEAFGRFSETIARFLGTARYLVFQTVVVVGWIIWNVAFDDPRPGAKDLAFDEYPFILLTLMLSLQASYAAPLILLAQNRQAERDRIAADQDRRASARALADTEYLARELAGIRLALGEMPTRDYLDAELEFLRGEVRALRARLEMLGATRAQEPS